MAKLRSPEMLRGRWRTGSGWQCLKRESKLEFELCWGPSCKQGGLIQHRVGGSVVVDAGAHASCPLSAGVVFGSHAGELARGTHH